MERSPKDREMECGIGCFKPPALQCCASLLFFTSFYCPASLFTSALNVYIASQVTTMEKYFGFSSSQSGFIMSCNDIGFLLTVLIVSYLARRVHIPRVLACCTILYGISGIICAFSYFLSPKGDVSHHSLLPVANTSDTLKLTQLNQASGRLCLYNADITTTNVTVICKVTESKTGAPAPFTNVALGIIAIGMILQGIGKSPRQAFITTYVDDNGNKEKTASYVGVIVAVGILGPGIGFGLGAVFSRIYLTLEDVPISVHDPRWIGAWWLGFLFFGAVSIVVALPLICFPRRLVRKKMLSPSKTKKNSCDRKHLLEMSKEFPKSILRLLGNGRYMCNMTGVTVQLLVVGGMVAFNAKYIEHVFTVPTWFANMLMGSLTVLGAAFGTFIGGFVTSNFKLSPPSCIKVVTTAQIVVVITTFVSAFLGCPNPRIVGYNTFSVTNETTMNVTTNNTIIAPACYKSCNCDNDDFFPVCGEDNRNYLSPCHAGCKTHLLSQMYTNCTCVEDGSTARPGLCDANCDKLWPFVVTAVIGAFGSTIIIIPSLIFQIRSVSEADKALAVGVSSFAQTLFGWLPGPVVSGKIIDTCCSLWTVSCFGQGACSLYDIEALRIRRHVFELIFRSASVVLFAIACIISRNRQDWSITTPDNQITVAPAEGTSLISEKTDLEDTHNQSTELSDNTILNTETNQANQI